MLVARSNEIINPEAYLTKRFWRNRAAVMAWSKQIIILSNF